MKKIGFIEIGIMGKPMAKNLLNAGYPVKVYDRERLLDKGRFPDDVAQQLED